MCINLNKITSIAMVYYTKRIVYAIEKKSDFEILYSLTRRMRIHNLFFVLLNLQIYYTTNQSRVRMEGR